MSGNSDNRRRIFADVVSVDAWHTEFSGKCARADLHADVVFGTGRLGGEADSPVRFRLSIKRAEIVVVIPDTEPVSVDKATVSRDTPEITATRTETLEKSKRGRIAVATKANASSIGASGGVTFEADAEANVALTERVESAASVKLIVATQSQTAEGHYRWQVSPQLKSVLDGRPWDGVAQPRLTLVDNRKDRTKGIPPAVRVEVHCLREDLVIEDLEIKDENLWEQTKRARGFRNRMAAAESYIRSRLTEVSLEVKEIHDKFGFLTVASVTAESHLPAEPDGTLAK